MNYWVKLSQAHSNMRHSPCWSDMKKVHATLCIFCGIGIFRHMCSLVFISGHRFSILTAPSLTWSRTNSVLVLSIALVLVSSSLATTLLTCWSSVRDTWLYNSWYADPATSMRNLYMYIIYYFTAKIFIKNMRHIDDMKESSGKKIIEIVPDIIYHLWTLYMIFNKFILDFKIPRHSHFKAWYSNCVNFTETFDFIQQSPNDTRLFCLVLFAAYDPDNNTATNDWSLI